MKFFEQYNRKIQTILEDMGADAGMTTGSTLGPTQGHPTNVGQSGDFIAPGDARNIYGSAEIKNKAKKRGPKQKKSKFKPPGFKEGSIIRRTFPTM